MGMYTGLRCKIKIKEECLDIMEELQNIDYEWSEHSLQEFRDFGEVDRATFIPKGILSYMPYCWEKLDKDIKNKFDKEDVEEFNRNFDKEGKIWSFQCSLKNSATIDYFIEKIIPIVAEEIIHLEMYYEEWETSILYQMDENKNIYKLENGLRYIDDYYGCEFVRPIPCEEYESLSKSERIELFYTY